ncbi:hypothetical protein KMW28_01065 [Flammeovirga yaeyamensis]|uniref:Uncharacterized protein n=1 Tax=Flammeovirga yaeyamensis TaxID=367791 RepID=A0AAX1N3T9_9BACT|nr:hypothetical protein [Flammeovirga yaeyamensis]MBB3699675.1 hypothetical protein [Flammeovirga yaeyamensis]NMF36755.1 hypothetical protein [Flammeovirga yaeyamensis]QWG02204.1 hypothetical protein KMW28_01065 [Flammeovirga yaeyamensis]
MSEHSTYRPEDQFDDSNMQSQVKPSHYYYSYSYLYKWINIKENEDKVFHLGEDHFIKMTTIFFELNLSSTRRKFERRYIQKLSITRKKLIIPLLTGGILGPIIFLASLSGVVNAFTGFSIFLACAFLFYYGFTGNYQIEVSQKNGVQNQFFVDANGPDLQKFINRCQVDILQRNRF